MDDLDDLKAFRAERRTDVTPEQLWAAWSALRDRLEPPNAPSSIRPPIRRRRWIVVGVGVAAAVSMAVALPAILPSGGPGSASRANAAGVSFTDQGGFVIARITNPTADVAQMEAAFAQRGFDITVTLIPVSPSLVGTIPYLADGAGQAQGPTDEVQVLTGPGCVSPGGGASCPIGLLIPAGFQGHASITVGRPAEPGEAYTSAADAIAPGEALHCSGILGMTVGEALPVLQRLGLTARWRSEDGQAGVGDDTEPSTIADQFVTDAVPGSPSTVYVFVSVDKPDFSDRTAYMALLNEGC